MKTLLLLPSVLLSLVLVSCGPPDMEYKDRLNEKYGIEVVSVQRTGRSGGAVVYETPSGEVCSALPLENDVLIQAGCGEVPLYPG